MYVRSIKQSELKFGWNVIKGLLKALPPSNQLNEFINDSKLSSKDIGLFCEDTRDCRCCLLQFIL